MIIIPFLFFLGLFVFIIKRNGFDVSACITMMYVITTFFSVILGNYDYQFPYENYSEIEIGIIPTIVFCFTIGICIYPFYKYNSNKKRSLLIISQDGIKLLNFIVYSYFISFILLFAIFWEDLLFRFLFGNMSELRNLQYEGELPNVLDTKTGIIRVVGGLLTIVGDGAYFMIPCFFYSVCALKKKTIYNLMIILSSLSPVLLGIINIDRSKTSFWIMLFVLSFFLFIQYIVTKVGGLLLLYLTVVTVSRFGERDSGTSGGLLVYLGQPFINFCKIWDNIDSNHFFTSRVLPLVTFALYGNSGTNEVVDYIMSSASRTGLHLNVFFTFVGMFLVDLGHIACILIPVFLSVVITNLLRSIRNSNYLTFPSIMLIFAFATILQCGIIIYFYTTVPRALAFWFFIIMSKRLIK